MADEAVIQFDGGLLAADCLAGADASDDIELTQYPIETGSFITDHSIVKPRTIELTLVQTETPIVGKGFRTQSVDLSYQRTPGDNAARVCTHRAGARAANLPRIGRRSGARARRRVAINTQLDRPENRQRARGEGVQGVRPSGRPGRREGE